MGIRYYKLFDLLNRRGMKKSDLRKIISSATVAKLSKGEYISGEAIEKICIFLGCQPGDIMEVVEIEEEFDDNTHLITKNVVLDNDNKDTITKKYIETKPIGLETSKADELALSTQQPID